MFPGAYARYVQTWVNAIVGGRCSVGLARMRAPLLVKLI